MLSNADFFFSGEDNENADSPVTLLSPQKPRKKEVNEMSQTVLFEIFLSCSKLRVVPAVCKHGG